MTLEPPPDPAWAQGPGNVEVVADSSELAERALGDVEAAHERLCRDDPGRAVAAERRWERERDALWDAADASAAPEETRLLVAGMREYAAAQAPTWEGVRYVSRLHAAVGRDAGSVPLDPAALERALDCYPDLPAGVRAADPDSPLGVAPAGPGREYGRLLERAVDAAHSSAAAERAAGGVVAPETVRARVAVAVMEGLDARERSLERAAQAREAAAPGPAAAEPAAARRVAERLREADVRFSDLVEALEARGVRCEFAPGRTGSLRDAAAGAAVVLSDEDFALEREWVDGERRELALPAGTLDERRAAVAGALRGAALAVAAREGGAPDPEAAARFGARMAARVYGEPLPVPAGAQRGAEGESEAAAARLGAEVGSAAAERRAGREALAAERAAGVARFEQVLEGVGGVVSVDRERPYRGSHRAAELRVAPDRASGRVSAVVAVDARYVDADPALSNAELAAGHARAYVAVGRALGAGAPGRGEDWSRVYGAVASAGRDAGAVAVGSYACAGGEAQQLAVGRARGYAAALREQVRADGFATAQIKRAWPRRRDQLPRRVEREGGAVVVPSGERLGLGASARVDRVLERDGKRLAQEIGSAVGRVERLARRAARGGTPPAGPARGGPGAPEDRSASLPENPATPPPPALGTAARTDAQPDRAAPSR